MAHRQPPDEVAIVAVAGVLRGCRDDARKQLTGVLDGSEKALHEFRIAMRRARSVAGVADGVLPAAHRDAVLASLRSMTRLSSPVRDLDVFISDLPDLADGLPGAEAGLAPLTELTVAAREQPSVSLEWSLRGPDGIRLFENWDHVSESVPSGGGAPGPIATDPAVSVVDDWTMEAFKRSRAKGRVALESDDLEHWHDLRKELKRLRYLVAAFDYLHRRKDLKAVRKHLKKLQEHIGLLQDYRVQGSLGAEMGQRAVAARLVGAADLAGEMEAAVARRLARAHAECTDAWLEFDTPETKDSFKSLTASRPG